MGQPSSVFSTFHLYCELKRGRNALSKIQKSYRQAKILFIAKLQVENAVTFKKCCSQLLTRNYHLQIQFFKHNRLSLLSRFINHNSACYQE